MSIIYNSDAEGIECEGLRTTERKQDLLKIILGTLERMTHSIKLA